MPIKRRKFKLGRVIKVLLLFTWHLDQSGLVISDSGSIDHKRTIYCTLHLSVQYMVTYIDIYKQ